MNAVEFIVYNVTQGECWDIERELRMEGVVETTCIYPTFVMLITARTHEQIEATQRIIHKYGKEYERRPLYGGKWNR